MNDFFNNIFVRALMALAVAVIFAKWIIPLFAIPAPFGWILSLLVLIGLIWFVIWGPRF